MRDSCTLFVCLGLIGLPLALACRASDGAAVGSVRDHTAPFHGGRIHWLEAGPADGPTVVLLHGARYEAGTWEKLGTLARLAGPGYRVLAVDLPGSGESSSERLAPPKVLPEILAVVGAERLALVAPSRSGREAFPFVLQHPERVAAFVAIAPLGAPRPREADGGLRDPLAGLRVPTLVLWGERDLTFPVAGASRLAERIPDARLHVFAGAGHACYLDRPEEFHRAVLEFLAETFPVPAA